jgi:hypothetical protein
MEEDASMNNIRWVAWGVVEVDGVMDRQQRRSILRKIRAELAWVLLEMGDHERSEDGGVRSAGAEAH